jgi:hypothetical protein
MLSPRRGCAAVKESGEPCGTPPITDSEFCLWHDPDRHQDAAEARRLGGLRKRREATLAGVYDVGNLDSVGDLRQLLRIAALDALGLDNSIARTRALVSIALAGARLLDLGELEDRLAALEAAVGVRPPGVAR